MQDAKFEAFCEDVVTGWQEVYCEMLGQAPEPYQSEDESPLQFALSVAVIVGLVGSNKGRILLEMDKQAAAQITEAMNGEPLEEEMDLFLYLCELANMVCGRAITYVNNRREDQEFRLTPPAIFSGNSLEIVTPNIRTRTFFQKTDFGMVRIDAGYEGV